MIKVIKTINKRLGQKGFGLIEAMAAMTLSVVVITSLVSLSLYTMRASLNSKLTLEASKIASREMELIRAYRDRSTWADFLTQMDACELSTKCYMSTSTYLPISGSSIETYDNQELTRWFSVDSRYNGSIADDNMVYISVSVTWNVGDAVKETHLYTYLSNWRE